METKLVIGWKLLSLSRPTPTTSGVTRQVTSFFLRDYSSIIQVDDSGDYFCRFSSTLHIKTNLCFFPVILFKMRNSVRGRLIRIRHLLPLSTATALANSLVSSKLDYCNSLYSGISQTNFNKLQRIQNSLARVITNTSKYQHIKPTLKKLHWLPIKQRIDYKIWLLTYKTLTNQQST